jgi:S1-C subfamily serine protease
MTLFAQIFVSCLLMFGLGFPSAWAQVDVGTLKKGVVKITAEFSNARKIGTGFISAKSKKHLYIVTASHVVEGEAEAPHSIQVTFYTHQEESFPAKIVKKEGGDPRGLALLRVGGEVPDDVQILSWDATTSVSGGEEIHLIGFPRIGGNAWAVTKGTLSGFDGPVLKFSGAVAEGNSGGPVLYQGRVIGVVMEVTGQFGNAKPAQIAKFTVENWPGYPRHTVTTDPSSEPDLNSTSVSQPGLATLVVQTTPADAQVFVDDEFVGQTAQGPVVVSGLDPDEYDVMVTKDGFRSWDRTIDLRSGERRTLSATLQEGQALMVTGVWKNPAEPTISYVLTQQGNHVTMTEVTTSILGTVVTAEGEGQLQGNQLELMYRTALGTMGQSTTSLSENGQQLVGTFQDFSNMIPVAISLIRTGESPPAFSSPGSADFNTIQNFGR